MGITKAKEVRELFVDAVNNTVVVLNNYNRKRDKDLRLSVNKVTEDDAVEVGKFPIIGVEFVGHTEAPQSLGKTAKKILVTMTLNIWYYHETLTPSEKKTEINRALGTIRGVIAENPEINNFALNSRIIGSLVRPRNKEGSWISAGVVSIEVDKVVRQNLN